MVKRMMGQTVGRVCVIIVVLMAVAVGTYGARGRAEAVDMPMISAAEAVGATVDMVTIDMWGRFDHLAGDKAKQTALADAIAAIDGAPVSSYEETRGGRHMIRRSCLRQDTKLAVVVAENLCGDDGREVCLTVRLTGARADMAKLEERAERIAQTGENFGGKMARNTCLRGRISGKLKCKEKTDHIETILAHLGARKITIQNSKRNVTCTAYAPNLGDAVQLSGEKVNLNIVLRDSGDGTMVYLGTPLLMMEY